jgi:uncharacterized membrane protein YqjE
MSAAAPASGLGGALRAIGATLADAACVRVELASLELGEEIERRKRQMALGALGMLFLYTAALFASFFAAAFFWDTHRLTALAVIALAHFACGAGALALRTARARRAPVPFAATRDELAKDFAAWRASP